VLIGPSTEIAETAGKKKRRAITKKEGTKIVIDPSSPQITGVRER